MMTAPLAVRYSGARRLDTGRSVTTPPGPDEVEVAPAYVGICGTDLHIFHGDMDARVTTPAVIGHEMSGRVVRVGPGVPGWQPGDPITVMPLRWDGTCPACLSGHQYVCQNLDFLGIDSPGAMQQRWTVPASALIRLPDDLPLDHAALVEPAAVAVHDVGRAGIRSGERVVVVGGGPVGVLIALVARATGADVRLVELSDHRRRLAVALGLATWNPADDDVPELVRQWTGDAGADASFEVSGAAAGVQTAVDVLAVRGRLCLVAIHSRPREVNLHRFFWRELAGGRRPVDILVNNAGTIRRRPAAQHTDADWDLVLQVNLTAPFALARAVGATMISRGRGKIIFTASLLSFQGGINVPGYTAAKHGIAGLTKALANEWAPHGVNVNAIAPGYIATDNTQALQDDPVRSAAILDRIPAGRWGAADDIAGATVFLASDAAAYVNGTVLPVDGGWLGR